MNFVRRIIPFLFLLFWLVNSPAFSVPGDSLKVRWINGQKYQLHKVTPKETWTSVAKKYGVTVDELQKANPGVDVLKINQIINVPASTGSTKATGSAPAQQATPKSTLGIAPVTGVKYHTVKKGETLYRIAKDYGITVKQLQDLNGLSTSAVPVGMKLKVSEGKSAVNTPEVTEKVPVPVEPAKVETMKPEPVKSDSQKTPVAPTQHTTVPVTAEPVPPAHSESDDKSAAAGQKIVENGIATWIADTEMNQNKFYALHRTAPVGTIIKVTNRMNNNSVYVKVIGVLPSTGDNENVLIKITQAAAQRIGALDQRFQAELSYAAQ